MKRMAALALGALTFGCGDNGNPGTGGAGGQGGAEAEGGAGPSVTVATGTGGAGGQGGSVETFPCPANTTSDPPLLCEHAVEYCKLDSAGSSQCVPLPDACGSAPTCACIPLTFPDCDSCTPDGAGNLEVFAALDCF